MQVFHDHIHMNGAPKRLTGTVLFYLSLCKDCKDYFQFCLSRLVADDLFCLLDHKYRNTDIDCGLT